MKKPEYRVRIWTGDTDHPMKPNISGAVLECLRYAGIVSLSNDYFDLRPPIGTNDSKVWAEMNAGRIKSFGFKTEVIPTRDGRPVKVV